jgi:predicted signal transduction protein with EAL and GGDEF domain
VSTSIGIALAGRNGDAEAFIRDADVAMYRAKAEGTARHAVFDAQLHTEVRARLELEEDLRRAIEDETLELRYQPIVRTASGAVGGFEALWRWEVDASDLLRIAEASGLIAPLGRYVLREAARRAAEWDMVVSVNVSARQLRDESFPGALEAALAEAGATPDHLRLEVTERAIDQDAERTLGTLLDLRERLGVRTYLDDFGTGTSSLRFLHRFPGDALKIDCGLVRGMLSDPASEEIVKAVIGLAHSLGLEVVAVGAETAQHLERLAALGCEYAQGFHLAAPLSADEVRDFLDGRAAGALV